MSVISVEFHTFLSVSLVVFFIGVEYSLDRGGLLFCVGVV